MLPPDLQRPWMLAAIGGGAVRACSRDLGIPNNGT